MQHPQTPLMLLILFSFPHKSKSTLLNSDVVVKTREGSKYFKSNTKVSRKVSLDLFFLLMICLWAKFWFPNELSSSAGPMKQCCCLPPDGDIEHYQCFCNLGNHLGNTLRQNLNLRCFFFLNHFSKKPLRLTSDLRSLVVCGWVFLTTFNNSPITICSDLKICIIH